MSEFLGEEEEADLGAERGAQRPRPTDGTVGGGHDPGLSGGSDEERLSDDEEEGEQ